MGTWLARLRQALAGEDGAAVDARQALDEAMRSRARVELEQLTPTTSCAAKLATSVEQVGDEDFVISQPVAGGAVRPLARYEPHVISFVTSAGRVVGHTQALGRVRIPTGSEGVLFGYRLALPGDLRVVERRRHLRILFGPDCVREAELRVLGRRGAIHGLVVDLSAGGALLRCRNADHRLQPGTQVLFKLDLPEPIGAMSEAARIAGLQPEAGTDMTRVRIMFDKRNEAIIDALRGVDIAPREHRKSA